MSFKIPCGGFKLDEKSFSLDENGVLSVSGGGGSIPKPLTYDYMPEGYPSKSVETVMLMEEQEVAFTDMDGAYQAAAPVKFDISEGKTYTVVWDGVEYSCVCHAREPITYIGNPAVFGLESTGEPFLYVSGQQSVWGSYDTAASHMIKVTTIDTVYQTIDVNMLPKAGENYGVVKKGEIVTAYNFPIQAPHDQMVDAIAAFNTGNASIVWGTDKVISANYDSSADTISVIFADHPLETVTYKSRDGVYHKRVGGSSAYGELQGNQVRIFNDEGVYTVLSTEGPQSDAILYANASKIRIDGAFSGFALILNSSTSNSTKKFKITVDDSGTIKATEVT